MEGFGMQIDLKPTTQYLLQILIETPAEDRQNLPLEVLATKSGVHRCTVSRHLKHLNALKLVTCKRGRGLGKCYSIRIEREAYFFTANGGRTA